MADQGEAQQRERRYIDLLVEFGGGQAHNQALDAFADALDSRPEVDADDFRSWFDERLRDSTHPNYLSPQTCTEVFGDYFHPNDWARAEKHLLRPIRDAIWKNVPETDRLEFPQEYGSSEAPEHRRSRPRRRSPVVATAQIPPQTRGQSVPDAGARPTPAPDPNPASTGPKAPGVVTPDAPRPRTAPTARPRGAGPRSRPAGR